MLHESDIELLLADKRQIGSIYLTNFRLVFLPEKHRKVQNVPLGCIAQIDISYNIMRITCKYFRVIELCWTLCPSATGMGAQDLSVSAYMWGAASMTSSAVVNSPLVSFRQAIVDQCATPFGMVAAFMAPVAPAHQMIYSGIEQELVRLKVPTGEWRVSHVNERFGLCSSYPRTLCIPKCITDEQLKNVASFRSSGRLPALCWYNASTGAALLRSAQPLVGLLRACSTEDQNLMEAVRQNAMHRTLAGSAQPIYLVDARPKMSAYANQAKGAGTENPANYVNSRQVFLGIENIHSVRSSYKALLDLLLGQCLSGESSTGWYAGIEKTGWMEHVQSVVRGAAKVAEMLERKASVLIHCSDGWDRTAQVSSLVQIMMDPFYRTMRGFAVLIEKEWLSFGHKFEDRHSQKKLGFWTERESSPIFAQWLDAVYQVMMQFPKAFEFDERLLMAVLDHSYSLRYVTFMGNCERTRIKFRDVPGLWSVLLSDAQFINSNYCPCSAMLKTEWHSPAMMTIWKHLYLRFFVRHSNGPGSGFSNSEPDFVRADVASSQQHELGWNVRSSRDDQICMSEEQLDLTIFDDYENCAKEISLREPKTEDVDASFASQVLLQCHELTNAVLSHPILAGTK